MHGRGQGRKGLRGAIAALVCLCLCTACDRTPDGVIPPGKMAELLADLNVAESVVDLDRRTYPDDSARMALKQSVYARLGVTSAEVDSSYMYYGHHLKQYMDIHDDAVEILQDRLDRLGEGDSAEGVTLAVAGDSVNVWSAPSAGTLSQLSPGGTLAFSINADSHWERGDWYTFTLKTLNGTPRVRMQMVVDYTDGTSEYSHYDATAEDGGTSHIMLYTDSARQAARVYGQASFDLATPRTWARRSPVGERLYIDSVALIRRRLDPLEYGRRYTHGHFKR